MNGRFFFINMIKTANPSQKAVLVILAAGTLGVLFYIVWFTGFGLSAASEDVTSSLGLIMLALLGAVLGGAIVLSPKTTSAIRRAWLLIGLACLSNSIAEMLWFYYAQNGLNPFPSLADVFYILFYPLLLAGVLNLPYLPAKNQYRLMTWVDMSIVMVVGAMLIWSYILGPVVIQNTTGVAGLISLAYPVGDFLILAGLVSLIQRELNRIGRSKVFFLVVSMITTGLADLLFALVQNEGSNVPMVFMNALWLLSAWSLLMAAGWQILQPTSEPDPQETGSLSILRNYIIYLAPILGVLLAVSSLANLIRLDKTLVGTVLLTILLLVLIYSRQAIVLHENRQLYQKMENLAITDALTSLYNRHSFNEAINREINRTKRTGRDLSLLIIDVDDFKKFNDVFGHLKGDQVLHDISLALKEGIRKTDFLARYGGDEFVLILPETSLEDANRVSEKIQNLVKTRFSKDNLGVSIGIALYQPGMNEQALVGEADNKLYQQKHLKTSNQIT